MPALRSKGQMHLLIDKLRLMKKLESIVDRSFIAMPDLYLDHFANFDDQPGELMARFESILERGGGNMPPVPQDFCLGGNATNFSITLAGLGAKVTLIARTNEFGYGLLGLINRVSSLDLAHVKVDGSLSSSFILEVKNGALHANIMISDPGSVKDFSFDRLSEADLEGIEESDYVCVFNWSQNLSGTDLATQVFEFAKQTGGRKTFLDLSDPSWRMDEIPKLMNSLSCRGLLDILGVNENEVRQICRAMGLGSGREPIDLAMLLSKEVGFDVALHTPIIAALCQNGDSIMVPTFDIIPVRVTGAGDAWNAGYFFGDAIGLDTVGKLFLANATAAAVVSKSPGHLATVEDVKRIITSRDLIDIKFRRE